MREAGLDTGKREWLVSVWLQWVDVRLWCAGVVWIEAGYSSAQRGCDSRDSGPLSGMVTAGCRASRPSRHFPVSSPPACMQCC